MVDLSIIQTELDNEQILNRSNTNVNAVSRQETTQPTEDQNLTPKDQEQIKDSKSSRWLRMIYAFIAIGFALASVIYWMRFVHFYYIPEKHSDAFFATLTTACTINILVAFHAIVKGLFSSKNN